MQLVHFIPMVRVLFVCLGNICRSPLAQGVFENVLRREGLEDAVFVDSAGTGSWHISYPPDERAQRSAGLRGLNLSTQRARRVTLDDCQSFDYILTMDEENYRAVGRRLGTGKVGKRAPTLKTMAGLLSPEMSAETIHTYLFFRAYSNDPRT
jgi:protein-tyrosine phosphatase